MADNYVSLLFKMGLSSNEAKVYLALLKKNISNVSEIVTVSGVPQKMIYYVLQKLMQKGLCSLIPGKIKRYKPIDPNTGIGDFIEQAQKQITQSQEMLSGLAKQFETGKNDKGKIECLEVIQNANQLFEKMMALEKKAEDEVLSFNKEPYIMNKRNEEEFKGLRRGIKFRSIYEVPEVSKLINRSVMEMYMEAGEEVRITEELPSKMMLFDNKALMFVMEECITPGINTSIVIVQHSSIIKAMKELFEVYWQRSMTVEEFKEKYKGSISLMDKKK